MKLIYSYNCHQLAKISLLLFCNLLCFFISTPILLANPIKSDIATIENYIQQQNFTEAISYTNKAYQEYMEQGDINSAYSMLIKQLDCLPGKENENEFLRVSQKIKTDLDPEKNMPLIRESIEKRCMFFMMHDEAALDKEYKEIMALEKSYGTDDEYVYAVLVYVSRRYPIGEERNQDDIRLLKEIENLVHSDANKLIYFRMLGKLYHIKNEIKADSFFRMAIEYIDGARDELSKASLYRDYSHFLGNSSKYALSVHYGIKALEHYENDENLYLPRVKMLGIISDKFMMMEQTTRAREYLNLAIKLAEEKQLKYRNGLSSRNAKLLFIEGKPQLALKESERAINYFKDKQKDVAVANMCRMGKIYLSLGDIEQAKLIKEDIIQFIDKEQIDDLVFKQESYFGELALYENKWSQAQKHFETALGAKLTIFPKAKLKIYKGLSTAFENQKEFEKAIRYNKLYETISDSINQVGKEQLAISLEAEYDRSKKDNEIALLNSENKLQQVKLSGQRKFLILTTGALLAFLALSFLLLSLFRKVKSQNLLINKSLDEKNTLLKEIHHRVKNNLQLVSSLLTLQSRDIVDEKAIEAIKEGKSRVRSMALIHQDLYSRDNLTGIGMKKYLENLSQELFSTYQLENQDIKLNLNIDDVYLDVDTIIPIGLIINELMTNALKYAFDGRESGELNISFKEQNNKLVLDVQDNGVGIAKDGFKKVNSFGNKLINTLTEQLDGSINVKSEEGTHVHLEFKDYKLAS